ncbi:hypothetical protein M8818_000621 [Zalaria obscura]|uniref:Uncharacterized protein n=1 Tax=Zalaria obscura TaxID=2024903 RepID=A0ACC3SNV7_9PEZI
MERTIRQDHRAQESLVRRHAKQRWWLLTVHVAYSGRKFSPSHWAYMSSGHAAEPYKSCSRQPMMRHSSGNACVAARPAVTRKDLKWFWSIPSSLATDVHQSFLYPEVRKPPIHQHAILVYAALMRDTLRTESMCKSMRLGRTTLLRYRRSLLYRHQRPSSVLKWPGADEWKQLWSMADDD